MRRISKLKPPKRIQTIIKRANRVVGYSCLLKALWVQVYMVKSQPIPPKFASGSVAIVGDKSKETIRFETKEEFYGNITK